MEKGMQSSMKTHKSKKKYIAGPEESLANV